jgi:hypothetical protein
MALVEEGVELFKWERYPSEFAMLILGWLSYKELSVCLQVSKTWNEEGQKLERLPRYVKQKYLLRWNDFIQFDEERMNGCISYLTLKTLNSSC